MGSPITFSGFNNIDFNTVLNAMMAQAAVPLTNLQRKQETLRNQVTSFGTLASHLSAVQSAANALTQPSAIESVTASTSDPSAVAVSASGSALPGHYDVVVRQLARAQVTASQSTAPDADTTAVATAGLLSVSGISITVTQPVTLRQLADAINASDAPVTAAVVQAGPGSYRLVLTASGSGSANAFTITNQLTGGQGVAFGDADGDQVSGDSTADNAVQATDAEALINNISVTSSTNTLSSVLPGITLNLLRTDPNRAIAIDVAATSSALKERLTAFVTAYNTLAKFVTDQAAASRSGSDVSIGNNPLVKAAKRALRDSLASAQTTGGSLTNLSQIGLEFTRSGTLEFKDSTFNAAVQANAADVRALVAGGGASGAFARIAATVDQYTSSSGLLQEARQRLDAGISKLGNQIDTMSERLSKQRLTLQREFVAAEEAMTRLKSQSGSLASFSNGLTAAV